MSAGRKIGGIIALILGFVQVLLAISWIILYPGSFELIRVILYIVFGVLILLGALMALGNKQGGGILVLILGIVSIAFAILASIPSLGLSILMPYSFLDTYFGVVIPYVTLESIVLVFAGIIIIVSPE